MANSKQKGNKFENKVAKILEKELGLEFIRTPSSGAMGTVNNKDSIKGDILCINAYFPFVVECKHYKDFNFEAILKGKGQIIKWLEQLNKDISDNKYGLLVFKKNYSPIFCAFSLAILDIINASLDFSFFVYDGYVFCLFEHGIKVIKQFLKRDK